MKKFENSLKGIHPGKYLYDIFKDEKFVMNMIEKEAGIPRQTLHAIINGKRGISLKVALKLELILNLEEGSLSVLQVYYNIKELKKNNVFLPR